MALTGFQAAVPAAASSLGALAGTAVTLPTYVKGLTIKNAKSAGNLAYVGGPTVTSTPANAWIELDANQSYTFYSGEGWLCKPSDVYVIGTSTAANVVFVTLIY